MADNLFAGRRGPAAPNSARPFAECYVAFLDILGYRAIIEAHTERGSACDQIARFERMLDEALRAYARRDGDAHWISARAFSDNICLAGRTGGRGTVWTFLAAVSHVTYRLALDGIFVRGAVVRGLHYDSERLIYSPALVSAYDIERTWAFYPRVVVDDQVHAEYSRWVDSTPPERREHPHQGLWRDPADGCAFVNYLLVAASFQEGRDSQLLRKHKQAIEAKLLEFVKTPRIRAKYAWSAAYHNRFCREHG